MNDTTDRAETASSDGGPAPLAGLTVIEMGHSVAAPFGGRILADLGARVIKIENPKGGDDARSWGPPFWHGMSVTFSGLNGNKFSAAVDLKNGAERAALRRFIVEEADIVLQNMRPGLVNKLGLGASLCSENSRLIYCNLAAFGTRGPLVDRPGYDPLMQAFGGIMSITGEEGQPPVRVGPSIIDVSTGMWAAIGILAALQQREKTGKGCEISTSLFESALSWVGPNMLAYLASGEIPRRRGSEMHALVPYKVFEATDGYVLIAAGNDNLFGRLAKVLGHPEWLANPAFSTNPSRVRNREVVNAAVQAVVGTGTRAHWIGLLEAAGVPCAELQTIDQVIEHPQTKALDVIQMIPDSPLRSVGLPLSFDGIRPRIRKSPPGLGADSSIILDRPRGVDPGRDPKTEE